MLLTVQVKQHLECCPLEVAVLTIVYLTPLTIHCNAEENRLLFSWVRRTGYFKGGVQTSGAIYFVILIRHHFVLEDESSKIIKETGKNTQAITLGLLSSSGRIEERD